MKKARGITLIEILIGSAIATILISFQCILVAKALNNYYRDIRYYKDASYVDESLIVIENLVTINIKDITVNENIITITNNDGKIEKIYFRNTSEKIFVDYFDCLGKWKSTNVVALDISNMSSYINGNVLYILITNKSGERVEKCFGIRKVI